MRNFILGTDWHTDCDDAVAVRLLARAHNQKKINLLGIAINSCNDFSVPSLDGFLTSEGVSLPLGIDLNSRDYGGVTRYQERLTALARKYKRNDDAEDGIKLYRRLLAQTPSPVEIIEIGFLQIISGVLESAPDDVSTLDGVSLFKEKVAKVWCMGGKWDEDGGKEFNLSHTPKASASAHIFCEKCPVPVTFLGFETGVNVITMPPTKEYDTLRLAMLDHGSLNGRPSWDPLTALLAITGNEYEAGYDVVKGTAHIDAATGENHFAKASDGKHAYVVARFCHRYYEEKIQALIE